MTERQMVMKNRSAIIFERRQSGKTYDAIANEFGITRERVRQILIKQYRKTYWPILDRIDNWEEHYLDYFRNDKDIKAYQFHRQQKDIQKIREPWYDVFRDIHDKMVALHPEDEHVYMTATRLLNSIFRQYRVKEGKTITIDFLIDNVTPEDVLKLRNVGKQSAELYEEFITKERELRCGAKAQ